MKFWNAYRKYHLMDEKKEGDGGGGSGGGTDHSKELADMKAQNDALMKRLDALEKKGKTESEGDDDDLSKKAAALKAEKDKAAAGGKALENAVKFNLKSGEFHKSNESLLPKDFKDLLEAAEKENYSSEVEKATAVKAGMVKSFFSQQTNVDLLTPGQKTVLEDWLKMTNTARQEKASEIYDMIFEPTLERLKGMKKAEALSKGFGDTSDAKTAYKNKLIASGKRHFLGEKNNGT